MIVYKYDFVYYEVYNTIINKPKMVTCIQLRN
jgi:hypothetical protein